MPDRQDENQFRGTKEKAERAFYPFTRFGRVARAAAVESWLAAAARNSPEVFSSFPSGRVQVG